MGTEIMAGLMTMMTTMMIMMESANSEDTNSVFDPCLDTKVQKKDGFTFGLVFSSRENFFFNQTQLSPCDRRLSLSGKSAQLAIFRPKVDEISLLTINSTKADGHMVAFAGRQYAARSLPVLVADKNHIITGHTLVLEFQKGTLQNLYWKKFGCDSCNNGDSFVCLNNTDCAIPTDKCAGNGGTVDCNLSIQLAFSGTDKNDAVFNSWYEVKHLRQYSLYGLYSGLRDSITNPFKNLF